MFNPKWINAIRGGQVNGWVSARCCQLAVVKIHHRARWRSCNCCCCYCCWTNHELFTSKFNDWTRGAKGVKLNSKPLGRAGPYIADALDRTSAERNERPGSATGRTGGPAADRRTPGPGTATVCTAPRRAKCVSCEQQSDRTYNRRLHLRQHRPTSKNRQRSVVYSSWCGHRQLSDTNHTPCARWRLFSRRCLSSLIRVALSFMLSKKL